MNAADEKQGQDSGRMVEALVELVRNTYTDELSPRDHLGLVRLEQTRQRARSPGRRSFWRSVPVLATALAVALAVPAAYLVYGRLARLTYQVANGTVEPDGMIRETRPGTVVVFSEGSQVEVERGTRARVASTTAEGGRVVLEDGNLRAEIVHRPSGRWTFEAGPYTIRVTGTAFDVRWSAADARLECQMKRGSVVITGPLVPAGVTLTGGMRLVVSPQARQLALDAGDPGAAPAQLGGSGAPGVSPSPDSDPPPPTVADDRPHPEEARSRRRTAPAAPSPSRRDGLRRVGGLTDEHPRESELSWTRRLALGEFQSVLTDAEGQGIDRVLDRASGADLSALADAARYTHHAATSRRALLALRARFPSSADSRDTAFFLGGLAEDEAGANSTAASITWYEQYLRESRTGRFVNEALGRSMVLTHKLRGSAAARGLADDYLRRFPQGPYAAAARTLLQSP